MLLRKPLVVRLGVDESGIETVASEIEAVAQGLSSPEAMERLEAVRSLLSNPSMLDVMLYFRNSERRMCEEVALPTGEREELRSRFSNLSNAWLRVKDLTKDGNRLVRLNASRAWYLLDTWDKIQQGQVSAPPMTLSIREAPSTVTELKTHLDLKWFGLWILFHHFGSFMKSFVRNP